MICGRSDHLSFSFFFLASLRDSPVRKVTVMTGNGGGQTIQNLGSLLPELAKVNIKTAMKSTVEAMGQKQKMGMDMTMDVTIQPKK